MANDVLVGAPLLATGGVQAADPETATLPTDAVGALTGFTALGLVGEDGVTETTDRTTEDIRAWGGDIARTVQTDFGVTYSFQFLETNSAVLAEVHGAGNVEVDDTTTPGQELLSIAVNKDPLPKRVYVLEMKDGDARIRVVLPNAQITNVGDVNYSHSDVIRYEVTITAYPDESGNVAYKFIDRPTV